MKGYILSGALAVGLGISFSSKAQTVTNVSGDLTILTNPAVLAAMAMAATNMPTAIQYGGIGSDRTGRSIGSGGASIGSDRGINYTVVTITTAPLPPTNSVAPTNLVAATNAPSVASAAK
jgi:hypothetical protein